VLCGEFSGPKSKESSRNELIALRLGVLAAFTIRQFLITNITNGRMIQIPFKWIEKHSRHS
jgi:hypothetical protein